MAIDEDEAAKALARTAFMSALKGKFQVRRIEDWRRRGLLSQDEAANAIATVVVAAAEDIKRTMKRGGR